MKTLTFTVHGKPAAKGSARAMVHNQTGRAIVLPDNRKHLRSWEGVVRTAAIEATVNKDDGEVLWRMVQDQPVAVIMEFRLERPKARKLEVYPVTTPDLDKLARAVLDALQNQVFADDKQVARLLCQKRYALAHEPPGVTVTVTTIGTNLEVWDAAMRGLLDAEAAGAEFEAGF